MYEPPSEVKHPHRTPGLPIQGQPPRAVVPPAPLLRCDRVVWRTTTAGEHAVRCFAGRVYLCHLSGPLTQCWHLPDERRAEAVAVVWEMYSVTRRRVLIGGVPSSLLEIHAAAWGHDA